jgi:hypothetical protein
VRLAAAGDEKVAAYSAGQRESREPAIFSPEVLVLPSNLLLTDLRGFM